jgi:hypothetical protein
MVKYEILLALSSQWAMVKQTKDTCSVQNTDSQTGSGFYPLMLCSFGRADFYEIGVLPALCSDRATYSKRLEDGLDSDRLMHKVDRVRWWVTSWMVSIALGGRRYVKVYLDCTRYRL